MARGDLPDAAFLHPSARVRPGRRIMGMSAVLLPFHRDGAVDWEGFAAHVERTAQAGLVPAVNMDTGYVQLLDAATRARVLDVARHHSGGSFVGGVCVRDAPGSDFDRAAHARECESVAVAGGTPIVFPSWGLAALADGAIVDALADLGRHLDRFYAFELGTAFVPYGRILGVEGYRELLDVPQCAGAKHSSLSRQLEWDRLAVRDAHRPDFLVLTGNDLAIDMVTFGSDYLLGLSTMAPDLFARRDALWASGDFGFYELNDRLQHLGSFAFRTPTPAYKHAAATFLHLRGWIGSAVTPPGAPRRPRADRDVLRGIAADLGVLA